MEPPRLCGSSQLDFWGLTAAMLAIANLRKEYLKMTLGHRPKQDTEVANKLGWTLAGLDFSFGAVESVSRANCR